MKMKLKGRGPSSRDYGHSPITDRQRNATSNKETSPISVTTIFMDDNGAEVTLNDRPSYSSVRDAALLDDELSPSRSYCKNSTERSLQPSPQRLSFCGIRVGLDEDKDDSDNDYSKAVESQVSAFKDNPMASFWSSAMNMDEICGGWHTFYFPSITEDIPANYMSSISQDHSARGVGKAIRHRTLNISARNEKLASIRHKLYPFHDLEEENEVAFRKSRSFTAVPSDSISLKHTSIKTDDWMASLDCDHILKENDQSQSPAIIRYNRDHEDYESDPEDFAKSRKIKLCSKRAFGNSKRSIPEMCERSLHDARRVVQNFLNERHTFVVHDSLGKESHVVQAWIERGQFLHNQMLAPKLVWYKKGRPSPKNWNQHNDKLASIDLLDIKRIVDVRSMDSELFPFAKSERCIRIKTLESSWIFETASKSEKEFFMTSLKLTVSRLATLLIVSDEHMVEEFFNDFDLKIGNEDDIFTSTAFS